MIIAIALGKSLTWKGWVQRLLLGVQGGSSRERGAFTMTGQVHCQVLLDPTGKLRLELE